MRRFQWVASAATVHVLALTPRIRQIIGEIVAVSATNTKLAQYQGLGRIILLQFGTTCWANHAVSGCKHYFCCTKKEFGHSCGKNKANSPDQSSIKGQANVENRIGR
jgi:hypothetical protein